jgi:hypothetical protein
VGCRLTFKAGQLSGYYVLGVAPALGGFGLERHQVDRAVQLVPFQQSAAIHRGGVSNRLELTCVQSTLTARINGIEVASVQDSTYDSGPVVLATGRSGSIGVEARFDNLVVREARIEP